MTHLAVDNTTAVRPRSLPVIGCRATTDHILRFDSQAGVFEEVNPLAAFYPSQTDINTQRLLLTPTRAELRARKAAR
jgi:hypothetical protein